MRIIKRLAVFSIASLITFGLGVTVHRVGPAAIRYFSQPSAWQVLLSFENQDLEGLDARVLSALTWLGGYHWIGPDASNDEVRIDWQKMKDLRARESVRRRLADLTNSSNFFVEHAAKAILKDKS